jgi:predicted RNase H-like HicB family nuclease
MQRYNITGLSLRRHFERFLRKSCLQIQDFHLHSPALALGVSVTSFETTSESPVLPTLERIKMTKEFNVIIERDEEGYYVASVPELQGCHTQAKSLDKLMERIREAIELCLEVEKDIVSNEFIGVQRIAVEV